MICFYSRPKSSLKLSTPIKSGRNKSNCNWSFNSENNERELSAVLETSTVSESPNEADTTLTPDEGSQSPLPKDRPLPRRTLKLSDPVNAAPSSDSEAVDPEDIGFEDCSSDVTTFPEKLIQSESVLEVKDPVKLSPKQSIESFKLPSVDLNKSCNSSSDSNESPNLEDTCTLGHSSNVQVPPKELVQSVTAKSVSGVEEPEKRSPKRCLDSDTLPPVGIGKPKKFKRRNQSLYTSIDDDL